MSFNDLRPIFVVGAPRSGTTLLQLILNAHPDVAIHGEIHFFDAVLQLKREIPDLARPGALDHFFRELGRINALRYIPDVAGRLETVRERMEEARAPAYELFFRLLIETFAEARHAARCGEKTPQNIRYLAELSAIFPRAKIVHIVRDPRDVVASHMRMPWAPDSLLLNALKWKIDMLYVAEFLQGGGTLHEMRYEDLVSEPEAALRSLCSFVEIPWDAQMLEFNRSADDQIRNEPWKSGTRRRLNADAISGWKEVWTPAQAHLVQTVCSPFLEKYGYAPEPVSLRDRASTPWLAGLDAARFLKGRIFGAAYRTRHAENAIVGEDSRLRAKMAEALITRRV
jgi:hypothetical protein